MINFLDHIGSDLSKMDQTLSNWSSHQSKNVTIKSYYIYHENNHGQLFLTNSDHIGPYLSKMDQNGSNLIKLEFLLIKKLSNPYFFLPDQMKSFYEISFHPEYKG